MARQAVGHRRGPRRRLAAPARQLRQGPAQLSRADPFGRERRSVAEERDARTGRRVDARDLTLAGALMLAGAAVLPSLPGSPGPACPMRTLTGLPCPLCGMTTSVEAAVRLRLDEALAANPAGIVAVAVAAILLVRRPATVPVPVPLVAAGLAAMWLFQLARFDWL